MAIAARYLLFDCADHAEAARVAKFWSEAMGTPATASSGSLQAPVAVATEFESLFTEHFPAETPVTSRAHMLFTVQDGKLSEEVNRLLGLGASLVDDRRREGFQGAGWVIMADPIGNEFRVQSNDAEVAAVETRISELS